MNYIPAGPVAAGLDIRGEIECLIPTNSSDMKFTDKIIAIMGNTELEIPIFACKPYADIKFERMLDFGNLVKGSGPVHRHVKVENVGTIPGAVVVDAPGVDAIFKITPLKFTLNPGQSNLIKVYTEPKEIGYHRELSEIFVDEGLEKLGIDISCQVNEQKLMLVGDGKSGALEKANFGQLFFGQKRTIVGYVVNNGPVALNFQMDYDEDEDADINPQVDEMAHYSKSLNISPLDGTVKAFSQCQITMTFDPVLIIPDRGFQKKQIEHNKENKNIARKVFVSCNETNQKMLVSMQGIAFVPNVSITPSKLRFGDCPVNDRRDILLSIINKTTMPTTFEFPQIANFKFNPMKGKLLGNETVSVVTSFTPPQLGEFKHITQMIYAGGLDRVELRLMGESSGSIPYRGVGGTDKLPDDFLVEHQVCFIHAYTRSALRSRYIHTTICTHPIRSLWTLRRRQQPA